VHHEPPEEATGAAEEAVGAAALDELVVPDEPVPDDVDVRAELVVAEELVAPDADDAVVDAAAAVTLVACEVPAWDATAATPPVTSTPQIPVATVSRRARAIPASRRRPASSRLAIPASLGSPIRRDQRRARP
jgi:hypothetical protein